MDWSQFQSQLTTINGLTPDEPGQNRLVYSPAWTAGQTHLITWGLAAGFQVTVDDFGSVYLDLLGTDDQIIAVGSHMDTVANGGRFDGLYGVLAGFQALAALHQQYGRPQHTLRLISFSEEEGSRFALTFSGSKHYARHPFVTDLTDQDGITFDEARQTAVAQLQALPGVHRGLPELPQSFTEIHIEQGPRLENTHTQIGLVTGIVGQRRLLITVTGTANHAGTTPMDERHDALQAAIWLINRLNILAHAVADTLTFTVGQFDATPNAANVIPGSVTFTVDFRHADVAVLDQFETLLHHEAHLLPDQQLTISIDRFVKDAPVHLNDQLLARNQRLATELGLTYTQLTSGAGHDSEIMNTVAPTTMLFVPSVHGVSHAPAELTTDADLKAGITILTASLHEQAY